MALRALPKVDFSHYLGCGSSSSARAAEARKIVRSCSELGFLWLDNTPLTPPVIERATAAARWIMAQPAAYKSAIAVPPSGGGGGMVMMEEEEVRGGRGYYRYVGAALQNDRIEAFQTGNDCAAPEELRRPYFEGVGMPDDVWLEEASRRNRWPPLEPPLVPPLEPPQAAAAAAAEVAAAAAECRLALSAYFDACTKCSEQIMGALELGLGLPEQALRGAHGRRDHTLEVKRYPSLGGDMAEIDMAEAAAEAAAAATTTGTMTRIVPHADLSTLTLLTQDSMGGLEVHNAAANEWVAVPAGTEGGGGDVLVNTGDFMARWSAGRLPSTLHRVVDTRAARSNDRFSLVFFACPDWDAPLHSLGQTVGDDGRSTDVDMCGDVMPF
jgi:isopenicillin N synthase-like dioxygenase